MPKPDEFQFQRNKDGSLSIVEAVYQALGAASMCWNPTPTGVFDPEWAKEIGDALIAELHLDAPDAIGVGNRFEDKDPRHAGRVVRVRARVTPGDFEDYRVEVEAHPQNPEQVGRSSIVSGKTLRTRYRRIL